MAFSQPFMHHLHIKCSWDAILSHTVDLEISFEIEGNTCSSLPLICYEHEVVDQTVLIRVSQSRAHGENNNNSSEESTRFFSPSSRRFLPDSPSEELQKRHQQSTPGGMVQSQPMAPLSENTRKLKVSRIPQPDYGRSISRRKLILSKRPTELISPQKKPVPILDRPPWRSPGLEDTTRRGRRLFGRDEAKRRVSHSADDILCPFKAADYDRSSREKAVLGESKSIGADEARQRVCHSASTRLSPSRYANLNERGTVRNVEHWLRGTSCPGDSCIHCESDAAIGMDVGSVGRLALVGSHQSPVELKAQESLSLPPSPSPSSQAAVPWTTVKYPNSGLGCWISDGGNFNEDGVSISIEAHKGVLYATSSQTLNEGSIRIRVYASVYLREDPAGGFVLRIPGLPMQSSVTRGSFTLTIEESEGGEGIFRNYERIAYVDVNNGLEVKPFDQPQLTVSFRLDVPFSINLVRYEKLRLLKASDFEVDYDTRACFHRTCLGCSEDDTIRVVYTILCSLRLREFRFWSEKAEFTLYLTGGPSGILRTDLAPGKRRVHLQGGQCDAGRELEVTLTAEVGDLRRPFTFVYEKTLGTPPFVEWTPRVSVVSQLSGEGGRQFNNENEDEDEGNFGNIRQPLLTREDSGGSRCQKSRDLSQERSFASTSRLTWYNENQLAPFPFEAQIEIDDSSDSFVAKTNADLDNARFQHSEKTETATRRRNKSSRVCFRRRSTAVVLCFLLMLWVLSFALAISKSNPVFDPVLKCAVRLKDDVGKLWSSFRFETLPGLNNGNFENVRMGAFEERVEVEVAQCDKGRRIDEVAGQVPLILDKMSWRDSIDRILGWRGPRGDW